MPESQFLRQLYLSLEGADRPKPAFDWWLSWVSGYRGPLARIGRAARQITEISDIAAARRQWNAFCPHQWVGNCFSAVPLLAIRSQNARSSDKAFRQFMHDLATLASL